jgi:hypothetical protein
MRDQARSVRLAPAFSTLRLDETVAGQPHAGDVDAVVAAAPES